MLAFHLLVWELYAIFAPEKIHIDIFELLKSQGCAVFFGFFGPEGKCKQSKNKMLTSKKQTKTDGKSDVHKAILKISSFFHR